MNSRIAMSALSIFASLAIMGGATYAFFSSSASSTNNTFGAGSMVLELDDTNELVDGDAINDVTATFNVTNMIPAQTVAQLISVHNDGTTPIAEIALGLTTTASDDSVPDGSDLRNALFLKVFAGGTNGSGPNGTVCSGGTEVTSLIDIANGNSDGTLTFNELNGDTYDSLPIALALAATSDVCLQVIMDPNAINDYQGDSANATFIFTAHQDISQI